MEKDMSKKQSSPGLRLGLKILEIMATSPQKLRFRDFQKRCGQIPSATLSRILHILEEEEWIVQSLEGGYSLGKTALFFLEGLSHHFRWIDSLRSEIQQLAQTTRESAAYAEWVGDGFLFRAKAEVPDSYHYIDEGTINYSPENGFWKVLAAYQGENFLRDLWTRIYKRSEQDWVSYYQELTEIRGKEIVVIHEKGIRFIAPVFLNSNLKGVVGISLIPRTLTPQESTFYSQTVYFYATRIQEVINTDQYLYKEDNL